MTPLDGIWARSIILCYRVEIARVVRAQVLKSAVPLLSSRLLIFITWESHVNYDTKQPYNGKKPNENGSMERNNEAKSHIVKTNYHKTRAETINIVGPGCISIKVLSVFKTHGIVQFSLILV